MSRNSVEDYVLRNITKLHAQSGKMFEMQPSRSCLTRSSWATSVPFMCATVAVPSRTGCGGTDVMTYIVNDQGQGASDALGYH